MTVEPPGAAGAPWGDDERWPALLKRIDQVAGDLLVEVEFERRVWRSHQPQLRQDPDLKVRGERSFDRVARHLQRAAEDARRGLEELEAEE
jgi:hypothetical protein